MTDLWCTYMPFVRTSRAEYIHMCVCMYMVYKMA